MKRRELTITAILIGIVIGIIMTAANTYLGLYAGMTVSASIPAAVIAMAIFRGVLRRSSIFESNIVQTMASAGESLAAGIIFTVPALVLVGAWTDFEFWTTSLIAIAGGLLGVVFMIPLRKALIVEDKHLTYPEGVACAAVLETGSSSDKSGIKRIAQALGLGALVKFLSTGLGWISGSLEWATRVGGGVGFFGTDVSPALVSVGYIVRLQIASLVFMGGLIGWFIGIPLMGVPPSLSDASPLDIAWTLWSTEVRYLGVGAMIVGGLWSIVSVRNGIVSGMRSLKDAYANKKSAVDHTQLDLGLMPLVGVFGFCLVSMFWLYNGMTHTIEMAAATSVFMFVASFLFVAVSSYVVGLVGTSNNPVSGMTISALLGTALLFLLIGYEGQTAILATLGVAAVVCCAACTAGDCSQDLKTGHLIGSTPRSQQIAQIIGVVIPAFTIAPILHLLHNAYVIGEGLKAPQATLFASITSGMFGEGQIAWDMVQYGAVIGVVSILIDELFLKRRGGFRLYIMPMAVGIYLPLTLSVPIFIGGLIRWLVERGRADKSDAKDQGVLAASGLIAGEAIMGVVIAVFIYFNINLKMEIFGNFTREIISLFVLAGVAWFIYRVGKQRAA